MHFIFINVTYFWLFQSYFREGNYAINIWKHHNCFLGLIQKVLLSVRQKNLNVTFHLICHRDRALNLFATGKQDLLIFQQVIHHNLFKKWHREFMFVSKSNPSFCLPKTYRMKREVIKSLPWTKYLAPVLPYMISITKKNPNGSTEFYWNIETSLKLS